MPFEQAWLQQSVYATQESPKPRQVGVVVVVQMLLHEDAPQLKSALEAPSPLLRPHEVAQSAPERPVRMQELAQLHALLQSASSSQF